MRIAVIGSGYVGTTLAAGLADTGHEVIAIDIDENLVSTINRGEAPIHEPGLDERVARTAGKTLTATTEYEAVVDAELIFIAVGTPSAADGSIDTSAVTAATTSAVETIIRESDQGDSHVIVLKSTVTPPQVTALREQIDALLENTEKEVGIELAMNPEFLREGTAVEDFETPDKFVFGVSSQPAEERLRIAFGQIIEETNPEIVITDPETAAMIKYANNAFLAAKISVINDIGNICKEFGLDAYEVADAIGLDHRISAEFLRSGVGYGGSCFPKDVDAIIQAARDEGYEPPVLWSVQQLNDRQPERLLELLDRHVHADGRRIAVLGLAFKPGTDDIRNSRAIPVIEGLLERGAEVVAYDPVAAEAMQERFPDVEYVDSVSDALQGAWGALVVTAWDEFETLDREFDRMAEPTVIDGRRIITPPDWITYEGLTW